MLVGVVLMAINPAKIQKINVDEGPVVAWVKGGPKPTPNDTVGAVPDVRAALGPGRNIAVKGDTVVVQRAGDGRGGDGDSPFPLLGHPIHDRGSVIHFPDLVRVSRMEKQTLGKSRLSRIDMRHDTDIPCL